MYKPADMSLWQGRTDTEEALPSLRWHQCVTEWHETATRTNQVVVIGFACDEGVRRNKGRFGAKDGPDAIRTALANQACLDNISINDAGTISCDDKKLESAQQELGELVARVLDQQAFPIVLGGGHEVAWGSYQGVRAAFNKRHPGKRRRLGIINVDAHFDLRNPEPTASSGTPFRQIAQCCYDHGQPFYYAVLGINPTANTAALFQFARDNNVLYYTDTQCTDAYWSELHAGLSGFIAPLDYLYLSICLDAFPASYAPGVSAPAALGVEPRWVIRCIDQIKVLCKQHNVHLLLGDIAEMNPHYDRDGITARLAGRLVHEMVKL